MAIRKSHKLSSFFLAAAIAIAPLLLVANSADAASSALFRMKRIWWGGTTENGTADPYISDQFHPRDKGPNKQPDPTVFVGGTTINGVLVPRFTAPAAFIRDYTWTSMCQGGACSEGTLRWSQQYSYFNQAARFQPYNSKHGGASMTTTVLFPTVGGNPYPNYGIGAPLTATTTPCVGGGLYTMTANGANGTKNNCGYLPHDLPFGGTPGGTGTRLAGEKISFIDGYYDFSRAGSIMISPGKNRFGGTMAFFYGPNHDYFAQTTADQYPFIINFYGPQFSVRDPDYDSVIGDVRYSGPYNVYRMTESGSFRELTVSGGFYQSVNPWFDTIAPFTTGQIVAREPHGGQLSLFTLTGYDNRTTSNGGIRGNISMIRPSISHNYLVPFDINDDITMVGASISAWQMTFHFREIPAPEPTAAAMLAAGFVTLAGLYRRRRY